MARLAGPRAGQSLPLLSLHPRLQELRPRVTVSTELRPGYSLGYPDLIRQDAALGETEVLGTEVCGPELNVATPKLWAGRGIPGSRWMAPHPSTCAPISPTSSGGNCFELFSACAQSSQGLPWSWIGVSRLTQETPFLGRVEPTPPSRLLPASACLATPYLQKS